MSKRKPHLYLQDILDSIGKIEKYIEGVNFNQFSSDEEKIDAVIRNLEIIGEAANSVPKEITDKYTEIPWEKMVSIRNKVLHEYFGVDEDILWQTVTNDLLPLKHQLQSLPESEV